MVERWTISQLESMSDLAFINAILGERRSSLKRYTPLERKLKTLQDKLRTGTKFNSDGNIED